MGTRRFRTPGIYKTVQVLMYKEMYISHKAPRGFTQQIN